MPTDCNEIIRIDDWPPDESQYEAGYYPEGTRDKGAYFSPPAVDAPLRPEWRYLLKQSRKHMPWQLWMEVMAYRIGGLMGVEVPPAYVGVRHDPKTHEVTHGALIEWFYGLGQTYIEGAGWLEKAIPNYDPRTGKQQNLQVIFWLQEPLAKFDASITEGAWQEHWAKVLTFDTVIGNVDRHPQNWGVVVSHNRAGETRVTPTPAFDNGTALCYELREERFPRFNDPKYLRNYLTSEKKQDKKARHHMGWSLRDPGNVNFFDFMRQFVDECPQTRRIIEGCLQFTEADLHSRLDPLAGIRVDPTYELTQRRLDFTVRMVVERKRLLCEILDQA